MHRIRAGLSGLLQKSKPEDISIAPASGRHAAEQRIPVASRIARRANKNLSQDDIPRVRRPLPPEILRGPAVAAAVQHPDIAARMQEMKGYLAELRLTHAHRRELLRCRDAEFLDLLVAMENDRDPSLRLSAHIVDTAVLGDDWNATLKATTGLARAAKEGMDHGAWHAVVSIDGHEVALSARHDAENPSRISLVVVDSLKKNFETRVWKHIAGALCHHLKNALGMEDKPADAKVWVSCVNTSTQITGDGGAIFALYAVREMPSDADVAKLHDEMRSEQAAHRAPAAARVFDGNHLLGARFFKLMAQKLSMDELLEKRPKLEDVPVNQKGDTLRTYQNANLVSQHPRHGPAFEHNDAYERKRLGAYERLIEHVEIAAGPKLSPARGDAFETASNALPPVQEGTPESSQPSELQSSFKYKPDSDEKSSVPSADKFQPADGTASPCSDRSKLSAQRDSDSKSSRRAARKSERRRSQNDAELTNAYERKRLGAHERLIEHIEIAAGPKLSPARGDAFETASNALPPVQEGTPESLQPSEPQSSFKYKPDSDEKSSVSSADEFQSADGTASPSSDRSKLSAQRDSNSESSRRAARKSERRRSQNDAELTTRQSSVDAGHHDPRSQDKARKEGSLYRSAREDADSGPDAKHVQSPKLQGQPVQQDEDKRRTSLNLNQASKQPRHRDSESSRRAGRRSNRSQNDDELVDRPAFVDAGRRDSRSHGNARMEDSSHYAARGDAAGPDEKHVRHRLKSQHSRFKPERVTQTVSQQPRYDDVAYQHNDHYKVRSRSKDNLAFDEKLTVRSRHTPKPADGSALPPQQSKQARAAQRDFDGEPSRSVGKSSERRRLQNNDELTGRPASVDAGRHSRSHGKARMEDYSYYAARRDEAGPNAAHANPPLASQHVQFEQDPYKGVPYRSGFAQGSEYQAAGNHRSGFYGPTVVPWPQAARAGRGTWHAVQLRDATVR
ncbi:MAG: hypothetical protein JF606_06180 [Burkholderiales bacterium]|nr:hypothetical protein [Burkholderiales bacterium]